jgi:hypothetical protein
VIRKPIKVSASNPYIVFQEVVLTDYGTNGPVDYVVVEATKDGITWEKLIEEHAANFDPEWKAAYDANSVGLPEMFVTRQFKITDTGAFVADDVILVRFRLFSNATETGWGFVIDNLSIQGFVTGATQVDESLAVFPNPVAGSEVHMRLSPGRNAPVAVQLVGSQGQFIRSEQFVAGDDEIDYSVGVAGLPPGLYLLRVSTPKGLTVGKFIKLE